LLTHVCDYNAAYGDAFFQTHKDDHQKIMDTLVKLKGMKQRLKTKQQSLEKVVLITEKSPLHTQQKYIVSLAVI